MVAACTDINFLQLEMEIPMYFILIPFHFEITHLHRWMATTGKVESRGLRGTIFCGSTGGYKIVFEVSPWNLNCRSSSNKYYGWYRITCISHLGSPYYITWRNLIVNRMFLFWTTYKINGMMTKNGTVWTC